MKSLLLCFLISVSGFGFSDAANAESVAPAQVTEDKQVVIPAPQELQEWVEKMDEAANKQRLKGFLKHFDASYTHADGLNRRQLGKTIQKFWGQYPDITYKTTLDRWEQKAPGLYSTQTTTVIEGSQSTQNGQKKTISASITSEQQIKNLKIIQQSTIREKTQIKSGTNPPNVRINLPDTIQVGEEYYLDVIVEEPLGDRILLGAAIEEAVNPQSHLKAPEFKLETLATGGLFKIGTAPKAPTDEWISAILIQDGGMLILSQRVSIVENTPPVSVAP